MTSPSAPPAAAGDAPLRRTFFRFLALSLVAGLVGDRLLAAGIELSDGNPLRLDGMLSMFVGLVAGPWWGALTALVATTRTAWETQSPLVTLLAVSRAPLAQIEAFKQRMGWRFKWVSSYENDFNHDFQVSFTPDEMARGEVYYNYTTTEFPSEEAPGLSAFYQDPNGAVFHTYSTYARGLDMLVGAYNYLDLAPKGRDEAALPWTMAWVRHHDRYRD